MAKQKPPAVDPRTMLRSRARRTKTVPICMGYDEADALEQARKNHVERVAARDTAQKAHDDHVTRSADIDPDDPADFTRRITADKMLASLASRLADAETAVAAAVLVLDEATEAARAVSVEFVVQAVGREVAETLRTAHPPTDKQKAEYAELAAAAGLPKVNQVGPAWNPDTYPPAFIAACLAEPDDFTAEDVDELIWSNESITQFERESLFKAAVEVQNVTNTMI